MLFGKRNMGVGFLSWTSIQPVGFDECSLAVKDNIK